MQRILLTIAYDGTNYSGWQKQLSSAVDTVEGKLEAGLRLLFREDTLTCIGASRTDAGVHALGQRVVFDVETAIPTERIPLAIRPFLPKDIVVVKAENVAADFHPRYDCVKKTYEYCIFNSNVKNPKERLYSTFVKEPLDFAAMEQAAKAVVGTHDFAAFCAAGSQVSSTIRTIFDCHLEKVDNKIRILVTGDGFLYHMVRILAGTLIFVGLGKINPHTMKKIIADGKRQQAGPTAEPQALTLLEISYDLDIKSVDNRR